MQVFFYIWNNVAVPTFLKDPAQLKELEGT